MKHLNKSRLTAVVLTGSAFFKAMEACLLLRDFDQCNTKAKIKFECEDCDEMREVTSPLLDRYSTIYTKNDISACIIYRHDVNTGRHRRKITIKEKLCSKIGLPGETGQHGANPLGASNGWTPFLPFQICDQNSDCPTNSVCRAWTGKRRTDNSCG